jgi:hypothetical protein
MRSAAVRPREAINGIMLTPVSNPDRPSTRAGNASTAGPSTPANPPCAEVSASTQDENAPGVDTTSANPTTVTTALSARNTATSGIATPTASLKPSRKTNPRISSMTIVMDTLCPCRKLGRYGFSAMWTVASAADSVIVMIQDVATKPSSTRTNSLPYQNGSRSSSIATEPCPCGLSCATRRYIGSMPSNVSATISSVASGDSAPAASAAIAGR